MHLPVNQSLLQRLISICRIIRVVGLRTSPGARPLIRHPSGSRLDPYPSLQIPRSNVTGECGGGAHGRLLFKRVGDVARRCT